MDNRDLGKIISLVSGGVLCFLFTIILGILTFTPDLSHTKGNYSRYDGLPNKQV